MSAIARTCKGDIFASSSERPTNPSMVSAMASSPGVFVAQVLAGFRASNKPETADRRALCADDRRGPIAKRLPLYRRVQVVQSSDGIGETGWGGAKNGTRTQRCRLGRPLSHEQVDRHAGGRLPAEVRRVSR